VGHFADSDEAAAVPAWADEADELDWADKEVLETIVAAIRMQTARKCMDALLMDSI
jgi:hypothetical protein